MASAWIERRETPAGAVRFRVMYRLAGRSSRRRYAGSFATRRDATLRKAYVEAELAAKRLPDLAAFVDPPPAATLAEVAAAWQASRVDVADNTRTQHRTSANMIVRALPADATADALTAAEIATAVAQLHAKGRKRETIRKGLVALQMILDHAGRDPNPARDRRTIRLPRETRDEPTPPTADHVAAVYSVLPPRHRLALLWLDWSGARVATVDETLVGDYDQPRRRVRLRAAVTKGGRAVWVDLPDVLADALEAELGPREDRDPAARLFASSGADRLRTAIGRACAAAAIPTFSPHDLRHRRISLLHLRGVPWAKIGQLVGQRDLAVTANVYSHVLMDEAEVDYADLLG